MIPKSTILIVDDDLFMTRTLRALLSSPDVTLATASNGEEALAKAADLMPDLILLDVMMPIIDGFEVCRRLRANPVLSDIPVVMVTSLGDRDSRLRGIEAGADDFISKPLDPVELQARVRTITKLNRYQRLMKERAKFERITQLAPDGIMVVDNQYLIQFANPALLRMIGAIEETEVLQKSVFSFLAPEQRETFRTFLANIHTDVSYVVRMETVFVRMNAHHTPKGIPSLNPPFSSILSSGNAGGEPFPVEINAGYCDWDDKPAMQIIARDITERKWAEESIKTAYASLKELNEELRHSRDIFRILFDSLDDGLALLDGHGLVLTVNQALAHLFGKNPDDLMYELWGDICQICSPPFPGQLVQDTLADGVARRSREVFVGRDGQSHELDVRTFPLIGRDRTVEKVIVHVVYTRERLLGS